jgi:hypothetical protein
MKRFLFQHPPLLLLFIVLSCSYVYAQSGDSNTPLTNTAVVKLAKAGFKEKTIITIIASRPARFDLSTERMIELKRTGLSEKIILAMMARQEGADIDDASFGDDGFFGSRADSPDRDPAKSDKGNDGSSMDIFGSSGGSKGSVRSRGRNGSSANDIVTTGSATVHILRPPTEAGGAPAKLEKTPSLTNDTVVELIEAGFSEGTIIRRIEQSPVAFDLAPEKLAELRKHRVTEKIMAAMKTAMGVDAKVGDAAPPANGTTKQ